MDFKHFSHSHGLAFHQMPQGSEIHCSGCKSPAAGGPSGNVYVCWPCNYFLHERCYRAARSLKHPSHPLHPLTLVPEPTYLSGTFICNSCNLAGNGFSYSCSECDFDIHVHCALASTNNGHNFNQNPVYPPIPNTTYPPHPQNSTYSPILNNPFPNFPNHQTQNYTYTPNPNNPLPSFPPANTPPQPNCTTPPVSAPYGYPPQQTNTTVTGDSSTTATTPPPATNYSPPESTPAPAGYPQQTPPPPQTNQNTTPQAPTPNSMIKHFSHPHFLKAMEIEKNSGKLCSACESDLFGPSYCCTESQCTFNLHKSCFNSPLELRHKSHLKHPLKLLTAPPYSDGFTCNACLKDGKAWAYTCSTCSYDLHIDCVSWPETMARSDHKHKLTLYYSSPVAKTTEEVTFMCDVCNNPVHEMAWMYCCRECDFGTHLDCVASPIKQTGSSSAGGGNPREELLSTFAELYIGALGRKFALELI